MTRYAKIGWLLACLLVSVAPAWGEEPALRRWTMSAIVSGADAGSLLVEAGVDEWPVVGWDDGRVLRLHPTWLTVRSVDGTLDRRCARLDRAGWLTSGGGENVVARSTALRRTESGWTLDAVLPEGWRLNVEIHPRGPSLTLGSTIVHPEVSVTGRIGPHADSTPVAGTGRVERSQEGRDVARLREGMDTLIFRTHEGETVMIVRERDRRLGHASRVRGVYAGGRGVALDLDALNMSFYPLGSSRWASPTTGTDYPLRWRLDIPALSLRCDVEPVADDAEIDGTHAWGSSLWRGSVRVFGWRGDVPLEASGTLELVGYGEAFPPPGLVVERAFR